MEETGVDLLNSRIGYKAGCDYFEKSSIISLSIHQFLKNKIGLSIHQTQQRLDVGIKIQRLHLLSLQWQEQTKEYLLWACRLLGME